MITTTFSKSYLPIMNFFKLLPSPINNYPTHHFTQLKIRQAKQINNKQNININYKTYYRTQRISRCDMSTIRSVFALDLELRALLILTYWTNTQSCRVGPNLSLGKIFRWGRSHYLAPFGWAEMSVSEVFSWGGILLKLSYTSSSFYPDWYTIKMPNESKSS